MKPMPIAAALLLFPAAAMAQQPAPGPAPPAAPAAVAQPDTQGCIGPTPPFKNTCGYPITVWYKAAKGGTVKAVHLVPGDAAPHFLTQEEKAGVAAAVCREGERAYELIGGVHGNTPWAGTGGYECRRG